MGKKNDSDHSFHDFVPVRFARNLEEAGFFKSLLEEHDIPVLIQDENIEAIGLPLPTRGVPVLVPDDNLAEAEDILEQRTALAEELASRFNGDEEEEEEKDEDESGEFQEIDSDQTEKDDTEEEEQEGCE